MEEIQATGDIFFPRQWIGATLGGHRSAEAAAIVRRFLEDGSKVRASIMFRGREMSHTELGLRLLDRLAEDMSDVATVEASPKVDGRNMVMVLAPIKARVKGGAKGDEEAKRAEVEASDEVAEAAHGDAEHEDAEHQDAAS